MQILKSSGVVNNPTNGQVLLDTGEMQPSTWHMKFLINNDTACQVGIEYYAQDGTTKLLDHRLYLAASNNLPIEFVRAVQLGEKFKVVMKAALTGNIQATVIGQG